MFVSFIPKIYSIVIKHKRNSKFSLKIHYSFEPGIGLYLFLSARYLYFVLK